MGEIREVDFGKQDVQAEVVELLESLLVEAKAGNIQHIVAATMTPSGYVTTFWKTERLQLASIAGLATTLQHDIMLDGVMRKLSEVSEAVGCPLDGA